MNGISVSWQMLLIKGIPECLIVAWAIHAFTSTPVNWKKYLTLAGIYIVSTYLIRFLPITLGINTVLFMFILILSFQLLYKTGLSMVTPSIIASVVLLICIALAELLNVVLLILLYGREQAEILFRFADEQVRALYTIPSTIFLALFVLAGSFVFKRIQIAKGKKKDGDAGQATSA